MKNFRNILDLHPFLKKCCHFFCSRASLLILRVWAQITLLQYFLHGWVTNLMFTKCRMILWKNRAWEWGSSYSNPGCAPGFCMKPWASSLTSLILNLFAGNWGENDTVCLVKVSGGYLLALLDGIEGSRKANLITF